MLIRIDSGYYCAGIVADRETGKVIDAAPVLIWSIGKHFTEVVAWARCKGFEVIIIEPQRNAVS